jgi:hypothetical protein
MTNSYARGYCSYFEGKPFNHGVQACRALGDTVVFELIQSGQKIEAYNNTVISEGNVSIWVDGPAGSTAILTNNIMVGHPYYHGPGRKAGDVGWPLAAITVDETYSVKQNLYNAVCTTPNTICGNAGLVNSTLANGNPVLKSTSVARDSGADVPLPDDLYNAPRPINVRWDRGATEYQTP